MQVVYIVSYILNAQNWNICWLCKRKKKEDEAGKGMILVECSRFFFARWLVTVKKVFFKQHIGRQQGRGGVVTKNRIYQVALTYYTKCRFKCVQWGLKEFWKHGSTFNFYMYSYRLGIVYLYTRYICIVHFLQCLQTAFFSISLRPIINIYYMYNVYSGIYIIHMFIYI